ncbi:MAG: IS110 family transposase [Candidatus Eisenbacteria bacterium]|uniref:IS110 family transposase n=1 Tax=Eiseniibacteriota bacterium TaxID=2212470 RepID=A0A956LZ26_UNCEI|nr:IS110 family transposase [Candidatus Eisenbacteria bacterium]
MSRDLTTYVGLDVHKKTIQVAVLIPDCPAPLEWTEAHNTEAIRRLARRLLREGAESVECCYEAGPTGYFLQRKLRSLGVGCTVVAPSLIPVKPGARIKTDRRDARKLAELHRAGLLTEVHPPSESDEAFRDLCRCRQQAQRDLLRARHRMSKFLLRRHVVYNETKHHWGTKHLAWIRALQFDDPASQAVFESYLLATDQLTERLQQLDRKVAEAAAESPYAEPVAHLRCFRGIDTLTAACLVAELHDFRRFQSPRRLAAYLGLVPTEHSSGSRESRGSITKTGNSHVRRLLIEAAWHHRYKPRVTGPILKRRAGQPARVLALADRAQERLYARYYRMTKRGVIGPKVIVAMARELVGYLWAALHPDAGPMRDLTVGKRQNTQTTSYQNPQPLEIAAPTRS